MIKKVLLLTFATFVLLVMVNHSYVMTFSGAAPIGNTGAPSFNPTASATCGGCHAGNFQPNSPAMSLVFDNGNQTYTPGEVYDLSLTMNSPGQKRWGFSMVARDTDNPGTDVGFFMESDPNIGLNSGHIGHQNAPNNILDTYTFEFQWQAPAAGTGDVTFFAVGNAANGSSTSGDIIYSGNLTISEAAPTAITLEATVFLEGAYIGSGMMRTDLWENQNLPFSQPYNDPPWSFMDNIAVGAIPNFAVDWMLLELRSPVDVAVVMATLPVFVLNDGRLVDINGNTAVPFDGLDAGNYSIVLRHRNHLDIISANTVALPGTYDFSSSAQQVLGEEQLVDFGDGNFGMKGGDFNGDGVITVGDFNRFQEDASLLNGYFLGDVNVDRNVTVSDFNIFEPNSGLIGAEAIRY